ncbi:unnamed protein product [Ectocarpus sp. CCAP 1310/34]|nr:unnamed protein product [Ectocarpus sp. CCAP 1310/34]
MAVITETLVLFLVGGSWNRAAAFISSGPAGRPTPLRSPPRSCRHSRHHHHHLPLSDDHHPRITGRPQQRPRRRRRRRQGEELVGDSCNHRPIAALFGWAPSSSSSSSSSSLSSSREELLEITCDGTNTTAFSGTVPPTVGRDKENSLHGSSSVEASGRAAAVAAAAGRGRRGTSYPEGERAGDRSGDRSRDRARDHSVGLIVSMRQLSILGALAGVAAVAVGYEHGMAGFLWIQDWAGVTAPHFPPRTAADGAGQVHLTPLKSVATGLGAGFTRAVSRTLTFPLDTIKTRSQLSRLGADDRALLPEEMLRLIDGPATFKGVFKGFSAFLAQAGPSNAAFFLFYDALNAIGAAAILGADGSGGISPSLSSSLWPTALHLGASSAATVPANLVRTPAEVVKQRLQVGRESGNSLQALLSIVRAEGAKGLFVGGKEQLLREIPFNAVQFTVYECLKASLGSSELWADAALGAASSAAGALATQPVDTVKTRVMTKSVPGSLGGDSPGFIKSASLVAEAEGVTSLFLGLLPRLVLVSTGGAFYFWGQEFASQLMSRAGF